MHQWHDGYVLFDYCTQETLSPDETRNRNNSPAHDALCMLCSETLNNSLASTILAH